MVTEKTFPAALTSVGEAVQFIEEALKQSSIERKKLLKGILSAEELLVQLVNHAESEHSSIKISVNTKKNAARVRMVCRGSEFRLSDIRTAQSDIDLTALDEEQSEVISGMLLNANAGNLRLRAARGLNRAEVLFKNKSDSNTKTVFLCLLAGALLGLLLRAAAPAAVSEFLSVNLFSSVTTLFMNAIRMVVVPLVFFSIAESVVGFGDMRTFGRVGGKVIGTYMLTTVCAIALACGVFMIFRPGDPSQRAVIMALAGSSELSPASAPSLIDMLVGLIPANIVNAFLSADMLQIIFLAILTGAASGALGEYSASVQYFLKAGSCFFGKITAMIVSALPAAVFCIIANTVLSMDISSVAALAKLFAIDLLCCALMIGLYGLLILLVGRRNPLHFYRKMRGTMLTAFTTASSSGTTPVTMQAMKDMGVSPKIYSFSIPLGATINMDGSCMEYVLVVMFMMRVFSIPMEPGTLLPIFLTIMLLSVSEPGVPGGGLASLALLLTQVGVPVGALSYLIVFDMLTDFHTTMSNVTGDAAVTCVVAATENLLDDERYRK